MEAVGCEDAGQADRVRVWTDLPGERDAAFAEHRDHFLRPFLDDLRTPARVRDPVGPRERVGPDLVADIAAIDALETLAIGLVVQRDPFRHVRVHRASR